MSARATVRGSGATAGVILVPKVAAGLGRRVVHNQVPSVVVLGREVGLTVLPACEVRAETVVRDQLLDGRELVLVRVVVEVGLLPRRDRAVRLRELRVGLHAHAGHLIVDVRVLLGRTTRMRVLGWHRLVLPKDGAGGGVVVSVAVVPRIGMRVRHRARPRLVLQALLLGDIRVIGEPALAPTDTATVLVTLARCEPEPVQVLPEALAFLPNGEAPKLSLPVLRRLAERLVGLVGLGTADRLLGLLLLVRERGVVPVEV